MREILVLIYELSLISNLKFVGKTSLFIQGFVEEISDVDVLVQDFDEISRSFDIKIIEEPIYKFTGRKRAYFIREGIMVDIFSESNSEETIDINGRICSTINSEITFKKRVLNLPLPDNVRKEVNADINYLEGLR